MILYLAIKGKDVDDCVRNILHPDMIADLRRHDNCIGITQSGIEYDFQSGPDADIVALANLMDT